MPKKTTKKPMVTILMPAYNCEQYIGGAIDSILGQTYQNFELLIVDDASIDGTARIVRQYSDPRIVFLQNVVNQGYLAVVNRLFKLSSGRYVAFQDADDWSSPFRIEFQLDFLEKNPEIYLCGTRCIKIFESGRRSVVSYPLSHGDLLRQLRLGRTALFCGASIMARAEVLDKIGGYREFFDRIGAEDIDWYIRILEHYRGENLPVNLYFYRQHSNSVTKSSSQNVLRYYSSDIAYLFHLQRLAKGFDLGGEGSGCEDARIVLEASIRKLKSVGYPVSYGEQIFELALHGNIREAVKIYRQSPNGVTKRCKLIVLIFFGRGICLMLRIVPGFFVTYLVGKRRRKFTAKILKELNLDS